MENGPISTQKLNLNFSKMTALQIYELFIKAVEERNDDLVRKCIERDGLCIQRRQITVPGHFAKLDDIDACVYLEKFSIPKDAFIIGALIGNNIELLQNELKKHDLRKYGQNLVMTAVLLGLEDLFLANWYKNDIFALMIYVEMREPRENKAYQKEYAIHDPDADYESLLARFPENKPEIAARFGDEPYLMALMQDKNWSKDNRAFAIAQLVRYRHFDLADRLYVNKNAAEFYGAALGAIIASDLEKALFYAEHIKNDEYQIVKLALFAIRNGDLTISFKLLQFLPNKQKHYKKLSLEARDQGFLYAASFYTRLDSPSNTTPVNEPQKKEIKPDFDNLTNFELYDVFIEAVRRRDYPCMKECIRRDVLNITRNPHHRVPTYFASMGDKESCEIIYNIKPYPKEWCVIGALWGGYLDLARYYLQNSDLRNNMIPCAHYARVMGTTEALCNVWYSDQKTALINEINAFNPQLDEITYDFEINFSKKTLLELLERFPEAGMRIALARGNDDLVFKYLIDIETKELWQKALLEATSYNKALVPKLLKHRLAQKHEFDFVELTKKAILFSDRSLVLKYLSKIPRPIFDSCYVSLAKLAAGNGEKVIAGDILDRVADPLANEILSSDLLADEATQAGYKFVADFFRLLKRELQKGAQETPQDTTQETPPFSLSKFIHENVATLMDLSNINPVVAQISDKKLDSEDLNFLLEQVLLTLEKQRLVRLTQDKNANLYVMHEDQGFAALKKVSSRHSTWIAHFNFAQERAKLETLNKKTTVTFAKFYEFYNELTAELLTPSIQPAQATAPAGNRQENPQSGAVNKPAETDHPAKTTRPKQDKSRFASPAIKPNLAVQFQNSKKKKKSKSNKQKNTTTKSQVTTKSESKASSTLTSSSAPTNALPTLPKMEYLPLKDSKLLDLNALLRKDDKVSNKPEYSVPEVIPSTYISLLEEMIRDRNETQMGIANAEISLLIHDLAFIDLMFKINRDLQDEDFATHFIHTITHYLMKDTPAFSNVASYLQTCFAAGATRFARFYLDSFTQESHAFTRALRKNALDEIQPIERIKLIREFAKLAPLCYQLTRNLNPKIARIGRYGLSGFLMICGEQIRPLKDTEIGNQLLQMPIFKALNEFRLYRVLRHGTEFTREVEGVTFMLERQDWEPQLDQFIANFPQKFDLNALEQSLDRLIVQEGMKKLSISPIQR